jgi:hypothetical protein
MLTEEENAGISYAMNHYGRQVMIGNHPLEPPLDGRGSRAQIDGLLPPARRRRRQAPTANSRLISSEECVQPKFEPVLE